MCRKKILRPDTVARTVLDLEFDSFYERGFRLVILDLDNTPAAHGSHLPDDFAIEAIRVIKSAGLQPALVSNAKTDRAIQFAKALDMPVIPMAGKPFARKIRRLISHLGFTESQTMLIGDQIFTDVLAARNAGVHSVLVLPRFPQEAWNVRIKRFLEKPFVRGLPFDKN